MHLLQSGVDITVIALWLGHEGHSHDPSVRRSRPGHEGGCTPAGSPGSTAPRTGSARSATGAEDLVRRFVGRTRTILPATTTIEWFCADALVDAERRIEARIAPSGVLAP